MSMEQGDELKDFFLRIQTGMLESATNQVPKLEESIRNTTAHLADAKRRLPDDKVRGQIEVAEIELKRFGHELERAHADARKAQEMIDKLHAI